jgi:hypothetical protein
MAIGRREFLKIAGAALVSEILQGCAPKLSRAIATQGSEQIPTPNSNENELKLLFEAENWRDGDSIYTVSDSSGLIEAVHRFLPGQVKFRNYYGETKLSDKYVDGTDTNGEGIYHIFQGGQEKILFLDLSDSLSLHDPPMNAHITMKGGVEYVVRFAPADMLFIQGTDNEVINNTGENFGSKGTPWVAEPIIKFRNSFVQSVSVPASRHQYAQLYPIYHSFKEMYFRSADNIRIIQGWNQHR